MSEIFAFDKVVYLTDTNAEGNVYFARYFDWQGMAREEFFRQNVPDHLALLETGLRMITSNAWMVYHHQSLLFDTIQVQVNTANLKQLSLELVFTFTNKLNKKLIGRGGERLAFANHTGELIAVPDSIRENAKRFLVDVAPEIIEIGIKEKDRILGNIK